VVSNTQYAAAAATSSRRRGPISTLIKLAASALTTADPTPSSTSAPIINDTPAAVEGYVVTRF
jgi:hypothetical protein